MRKIMRIHSYAGAVLMLAALSLPLAGAAQKFQQPTKEELQMNSDPKAPGASAVYLYFQSETDNSNHFYSEYARIKVLTEKGKEWATIELPYDAAINDSPIIEGRTIHSDGTVIHLVGKASDLLVFKDRGNNVKEAVFTLPAVEVGSILEYRWTIPMTGSKYIESGRVFSSKDYLNASYAGTIPEWDVQKAIYVHKAHFFFYPYTNRTTDGIFEPRAGMGYLFTQLLPSGSNVIESQRGDFTLDIQDVSAYSQEEYSPPAESQKYRVLFFWTPFHSLILFWQNEGQLWSKQLNEFASESKEIKNAAIQITAGAVTPEAKARKLYDAVQSLDNTDFTRAKTEAERKALHLKQVVKKAQDVWTEKSGSGNEIAALYLALARAAGLSADGLKVADRNRRIFDPNYLSLDQLDSLLVVLHIDGKDIYLDPGEKLCPFGQLQWTHILAGGIQQNLKAYVYTPPNATTDAITARAADLIVDAQGGITGTVKIQTNGPAALHWRQLNLTSDPEEVRKQLNESLRNLLPQGITGEVDKIQGLETAEGFVLVSAKVSGLLGSSTGKRLLLPGFFFSTGAHQQFVSEEKRVAAVDLHHADQVIDDVVYHLPAGFTVESAPAPAQLPWEGHAALVVKTTPGTGSIEIKHIFARGFVLLEAKEYPALRDYYQKIAASDQQQLVLVKAAGN
jgi:hypothetical protein